MKTAKLALLGNVGRVTVDGRRVGEVRATPRGWVALLLCTRTPAGPTVYGSPEEAAEVVARNAGAELEGVRR